MEVKSDGRLGPKLVRKGGLKETRDGLMIDTSVIQEAMNPPMNHIRSLSNDVTLTTLNAQFTSLLNELRRTGRLRGF